MELVERLPHFYDVATSDSNWTAALDHFGEAVGCKGTAIYAANMTAFDFGLEATNSFYVRHHDKVREYLSRYGHYDRECADIIFKCTPFETVEDTVAWPKIDPAVGREDLDFLNEAFGTHRRMLVNLSRDEAWNACITLQYDRSIAAPTPVWKRDAAYLSRHLGKALEINRFSAQLRQRYKAVLSVLDHLKLGIGIALETGELFVQNAQAAQILDAKDGLALDRHGRLRLSNPDQTDELHAMIAACSRTAAGENDAVGNAVVVRRRSDRAPYLVEVSPIRDGGEEIEKHFSGAMVLIIDPDRPPEFSVAPLKALYGLTNAEMKTASLLLEGGPISVIAETRGVSIDTIKTQCQAIYGKIGVKNRLQLFRKAAAISPPIDMSKEADGSRE
ncbi:MAG: helix-turn-helix transcriptional regulator [Pseudomonadota bacterium]